MCSKPVGISVCYRCTSAPARRGLNHAPDLLSSNARLEHHPIISFGLALCMWSICSCRQVLDSQKSAYGSKEILDKLCVVVHENISGYHVGGDPMIGEGECQCFAVIIVV